MSSEFLLECEPPMLAMSLRNLLNVVTVFRNIVLFI